jgi:hypothetical protein
VIAAAEFDDPDALAGAGEPGGEVVESGDGVRQVAGDRGRSDIGDEVRLGDLLAVQAEHRLHNRRQVLG